MKGRPPKSKYDLSKAALAYTSSELNHKVELMKQGEKFYGIDEQELQILLSKAKSLGNGYSNLLELCELMPDMERDHVRHWYQNFHDWSDRLECSHQGGIFLSRRKIDTMSFFLDRMVRANNATHRTISRKSDNTTNNTTNDYYDDSFQYSVSQPQSLSSI